MQKEISNLKTDLMEASEQFQRETNDAIDTYMDVNYPGTIKPVYGDPPLNQPSQATQPSPAMSPTQQQDRTGRQESQSQQPPIFGNPGDILEDRWKAYNAKIAETHCQQSIEACSSKVFEKLHHLHKKSFDNIIYVHGDDPPNQAQISSFYTSIANLFNSLNIFIIQYEHTSVRQVVPTPMMNPLTPK
jgi:hypothetical protein